MLKTLLLLLSSCPFSCFCKAPLLSMSCCLILLMLPKVLKREFPGGSRAEEINPNCLCLDQGRAGKSLTCQGSETKTGKGYIWSLQVCLETNSECYGERKAASAKGCSFICCKLVLEIEEGSWPLVQRGSGTAFQDEMWEKQSDPYDTGALLGRKGAAPKVPVSRV